MGAFRFRAQCRGIRTRKGAELRKREAFSSAAREERSDEAKAGGASRTRHPSSPATELLGLQRWRPFLFSGPFHGMRTHQRVCHKGRGQKMAKMSTATLLTTYKKIAFTYVTQHVSIIRTNSWIKIVYSSPFRRSRAQTWCKSVLRSVAASPDVTPS